MVEPGAGPPLDLFPILKYVPERWASWKTKCREVAASHRKMYFSILERCEKRLAKGSPFNCAIDEMLPKLDKYQIDRKMAAYESPNLSLRSRINISRSYLIGITFEGGSDTTFTSISSLILILVNHPEVQEKARKEIDAVVGPNRSPTLEDWGRLEYVQCVVKEVRI